MNNQVNSILTAVADQERAFYQKYGRPPNAVLISTSDFTPLQQVASRALRFNSESRKLYIFELEVIRTCDCDILVMLK